jgi:hypothetical protein
MYIYVWLLAFLACLDLTGRLLLSGCPPLGEVAWFDTIIFFSPIEVA